MNAINIKECVVTAVDGQTLTLESDGWSYPRQIEANTLAGYSKPPAVGDRIVVFIGTFTGSIVYAKGYPVDA